MLEKRAVRKGICLVPIRSSARNKVPDQWYHRLVTGLDHLVFRLAVGVSDGALAFLSGAAWEPRFDAGRYISKAARTLKKLRQRGVDQSDRRTQPTSEQAPLSGNCSSQAPLGTLEVEPKP